MGTDEIVLKAGDVITLKERPYVNFFPLSDFDKDALRDTYVWLDEFDGVYRYDVFLGRYALRTDRDKRYFTYCVDKEEQYDIYFVFNHSAWIASRIYILAFEHVQDMQYRFLGVFMEVDEVSYRHEPIGRRYKRVRINYPFKKIEK